MIFSRIKASYFAVEFLISILLVVFFMWLFKKHIHGVRKIWGRSQRLFGFYSLEVVGKFDECANMIIMNHQSMLDIVVLEEVYPKNLCWIAKKEIADLPVIGQIIHVPQMISVERENKRSLIKLVKDAQDRVEKGRVLAIFPEGTRIRDNHIRPEIHGGFALIAQLAGCDVQPTAIFGALDIKRANSPIIRPVKIWALAGERISFADLETTKRKDQAREMEELGMDRVYELRDQLMREHPGRN